MFKEKLYQVIADAGIAGMSKFFPEQFAKDPVKPSDRYIEYPFAISHLPPLPARVLDVGCTSSLFPLVLSAFGYHVTGLDMRPYPIVEKISFPNFQFLKHNLTNQPLPPKSFDCVTAISCIEHFGIPGRYGTEPNQWADFDAMFYIYSCLKDEGRLILTIPVGIYTVIPPYYRVYGEERFEKLITGFDLRQERYFIRDEKDCWFECSREMAFSIKPTKEIFGLGLYCLSKK